MTEVIRQVKTTSIADVGVQLREAFVLTKAALLSDKPVVLCVDGPSLLGQADPSDAAVATGMLGLARALAFEGGSKGWKINVIALNPGDEPGLELIALASSAPGLNGQLLNVSSSSVGKVIP